MDQNIINTLAEFLSDDLINEIAIANGIKINGKEKVEIINTTKKLNNNTSENKDDENKDDENKDDENNENENKDDENNENENKDDENKDDEKEIKNQVKKETKNQTLSKKDENIATYKSIYDFLSDSKNTFSLSNQKWNTKTKIREIRYGFIEDDEIFKFDYFVFPVSVSQIKKLQEFLKEIETVFKGNNTKNYIPNFLLGDGDDLYSIDEKLNYLIFLVINFLNNNGKQLLPENIVYNNLKLDKITPELLKNPDFYKNFLIQEKSYIKTMGLTLNNPKVRFLKYYLIEFSKNIKENNKSYSKIQFLLNHYLKEVKAKKGNININQYKDLRSIISIIYLIIEGEIGIKKQLLNKINDLYEVWLFQKIIIYFNSNDGKIFDDFKDRIIDLQYYIVNRKDLGLNQKRSNEKILEKLGVNVEKKIYKSEDDFIFWNGEFYFKENKIDNEKFKEIIKDKLDSKLNGLVNYNSEKLIIGKGFIKEDSKEFDGRSTINLDNLSKKTGYNISISLGGHNDNLKKSKILEKSFADLIKSKLDHLEDVITIYHITPDYIIKIKQGKDIVGSIILDAKFSKYPFFLDSKMDYAPVLKYYSELGKNFSTTDIGNNFPYKVIILFPGDKEAGKLKELNNYFQRVSNIVAVPLMVGDESILEENLKYLEDYIIEFVDEIKHKRIIQEIQKKRLI